MGVNINMNERYISFTYKENSFEFPFLGNRFSVDQKIIYSRDKLPKKFIDFIKNESPHFYPFDYLCMGKYFFYDAGNGVEKGILIPEHYFYLGRGGRHTPLQYITKVDIGFVHINMESNPNSENELAATNDANSDSDNLNLSGGNIRKQTKKKSKKNKKNNKKKSRNI